MEVRQMRCFARWPRNFISAAPRPWRSPPSACRSRRWKGSSACSFSPVSTRRVQLTKPGEVFYERCIRVLKEIENSSTVVRAVAGKDVDRITIGNIYPATFGVLPLFLSKLGKRFQTFRFTSAVARPMQSSAIWRRAASISASSGRSKISARSAGRASPTNDVFWRCRLAARWRWRKLSQ